MEYPKTIETIRGTKVGTDRFGNSIFGQPIVRSRTQVGGRSQEAFVRRIDAYTLGEAIKAESEENRCQ